MQGDFDHETVLCRGFRTVGRTSPRRPQLLDIPMTEPGSPEQIIEERVCRLIDDLDELCALATDERTVGLVEQQRIGVGQIVTRSQLLASFLMSRKTGLRIIHGKA